MLPQGPQAPAPQLTAPLLARETSIRTQNPLGSLSEDFSSPATPKNVEILEKELLGHPDHTFVNKLCSELREGAHIGYNGPRVPRLAKNSAFSNPQKVTKNISKEVALGRTAGLFETPPSKKFASISLGDSIKKTLR